MDLVQWHTHRSRSRREESPGSAGDRDPRDLGGLGARGPHLADADPRALSVDERDLALYVHVLFPKGTDARKYVDVVSAWMCVEDVELPPEVSLPD